MLKVINLERNLFFLNISFYNFTISSLWIISDLLAYPNTFSIWSVFNPFIFFISSDEKEVKSLHGLYRSLIANNIVGVSEGYKKTLSLQGVGHRATLKGNDIEILCGFSHPVIYKKVENISYEVPDQNTIIVSGIDKALVGQVAANIRAIKPPEPYKGKGIRYEDEYVRRKAGKAAVATTGA